MLNGGYCINSGCGNRATLNNGLCHSCNDKPKVNEVWFVKLPNGAVSEVEIKKLFKKVVDLLFLKTDSTNLYKIDDVEFIEKVIFE